MSRYQDLSAAVEAWLPPHLEIDRLHRELPFKICEAVRRHLGAPNGPAPFVSSVHKMSVGYVALYRAQMDAKNSKKFEPIGHLDALQTESNDIVFFTLGICLESASGGMPNMI